MDKKAISVIIALTIFATTLYSNAAVLSSNNSIWSGDIADGFAGGMGTSTDPYIIETPEQLAYLAKSVNSGNKYTGKYIELANDIHLNDTSNWQSWCSVAPENMWTPIGTTTDTFNGNFNGQNHTISGIYTNFELRNQGLFGCASGATFKNIKTSKSYISGISNTGSIVGYSISSKLISNCHNEAVVYADSCTGGIVGYNSTDINTQYNILYCSNSGNINGENYVGGIVGLDYSYGLSDCRNLGSISGKSTTGGIAGQCYIANNSYNTGNVHTSGGDSGGIAGYATQVSNCYNTGIVTSYGHSSSGIAKIGNPHTNIAYKINNCYNTGTVGDENTYQSGGITAFISMYNGECEITDCYNNGSVTASIYSGGIVGYAIIKSNGILNLKNCYNTGNILGAINETGVIIGRLSDAVGLSTLTNCYYHNNCITSNIKLPDNAKGLTEEEMQQQASFDGYDFDTVWTMSGDKDYPYPELVIEVNIADEEEIPHPEKPVIAEFASGDGTADNPYIIKTAEQLISFANSVNTGNRYLSQYINLDNDIELNAANDNRTSIGGIYNKLDSITDYTTYNEATIEYGYKNIYYKCNDIYYNVWNYDDDLEDYYFLSQFSGNFNGKNHTISGLNISSECDYTGLFGYSNGVIENINLRDSYLQGKTYTGGIVGYNSGNVKNCINFSQITGAEYVGGIIGFNEGIIENCHNGGNVICTGNLDTNSAGGVVGYLAVSITDNSLTECTNRGNITSSAIAGGVIGILSVTTVTQIRLCTITNCFNTGMVTSTSSSAGGIAGYIYAAPEQSDKICMVSVSGCENNGIILGKNGTGGIVGNAPYQVYSIISVKDCTNLQNVSGDNMVGGIAGNCYTTIESCHNQGEVTGAEKTGGIVGSGSAKKCKNTNNVIGINCVGGITGQGSAVNCYNSATISGNTKVGGIIGVNYLSSTEECFNIGDINALELAGGVVGENYSDTTSTAKILNCYNTGTVCGDNAIGGIVGSNYAYYGYSIVEKCYNMGNINGSAAFVGAIAGSSGAFYYTSDSDFSGEATIVDCYYSIGCATDGNSTEQQGVGNKTPGEVTTDIMGESTRLSITDMSNELSFEGFDFNNIWLMKQYPELRSVDGITDETITIILTDSKAYVNANTGALIIAYYNINGNLISIEFIKGYQADLIPPANCYKIKAMLWTSYNDMEALCNSKTIYQ